MALKVGMSTFMKKTCKVEDFLLMFMWLNKFGMTTQEWVETIEGG